MRPAGQKPLICGLILAAGLSSRMGEFKPLMPLRGKTLIENTVDSVFSGGATSVTVVVGYRGGEVAALLTSRYGERLHIVWNHDYASTDMLRSIQLGCRALPDCDGFFLLPGDMPLVGRETFRLLSAAWNPDVPGVVFPTLNGCWKHPPLIDCRLMPELLAYEGGGGLRELWRRHEEWIATVSVDDEGTCVDMDTPQDYRVWRARVERTGDGSGPGSRP